MGDELSSRFDTFAKTVAQKGHTRRGMLKAGAGFAGAAVAMALPGRAGADPGNGNDVCVAFCKSVFPPGTSTDLYGHCVSQGAQGLGICAVCGPKAPTPHPPLCGTVCCSALDQVCCNGKCTSTTCTDGHVFNPNTCMCECPATAPTECAGTCTNLATDVNNCGACGHVCTAPQVCVNGTCACPNNAAFCGTVCCGPGESCVNGSCVCVGGTPCVNNASCPCGTCINGVCSSQTCQGAFCGSFTQCSQTQDCQCYTTIEGAGVCGCNTACAGIQQCTATSQCPTGSICAFNTCCGGGGVCLKICLEGACAGSLGTTPLFAGSSTAS